MKAIETEYNGYKFRSRLEARWAVFFDASGIKYEYELEGMEDGTRYLPDFYLPDLGLWVEVKPYFRKNEMEKCVSFISENKGEAVIWLQNIPNWRKGGFWWHPVFYFNTICKAVSVRYILFGNPLEVITGIQTDAVYDDFPPFTFLWDEKPAVPVSDLEIGGGFSDAFSFYDAELRKALRKARQARFEWGECP